MKFRKKPVDRSVIDAVKLPEYYTWMDAKGVQQRLSHETFELEYEPVTRSPRTMNPRRRKRKGNSQQPDLASQA